MATVVTAKDIENVEDVVNDYFVEAYNAFGRGDTENALFMIEQATSKCQALERDLEAFYYGR